MHRLLLPILVALATLSGPPAIAEEPTPTTSKSDFVNHWIDALEASDDSIQIEIVDELEIAAKTGELTIRASAAEAYESYLAEPATHDEQIAGLVRMVGEALASAGEAPDLSRIVPVIQKSDWLAKYKLDCPYYALPDDLIVVLAEDRPDEIRYLRTADLDRLGKTVPELFSTAIANLRAVAPVEEHDLGDFVLLNSGGNYEAGLLLDATLIARYQGRFEGEIVFAAPTADVFVLTGRDEQQGLGGIVTAVCGSDPETSLSSKVFAAREGALTVVGEVECDGEMPTLSLD